MRRVPVQREQAPAVSLVYEDSTAAGSLAISSTM